MKIIERETSFIVCYNPACGYEKEYNLNETDTKTFVGAPCPKCGENLLTEDDYKRHLQLMEQIGKINKYLGWLSIFGGKKRKVQVHVHDGINITEKEIK